MQKLSTPVEHIDGAYEIVVIGSGYGGSITASRMSRAGRQVAILERGREISPGEFVSPIFSPMKLAAEHAHAQTILGIELN